MILLTGLLGTAALDPDCTMLDVAHWVFTKDIPQKKKPNGALPEIALGATRIDGLRPRERDVHGFEVTIVV